MKALSQIDLDLLVKDSGGARSLQENLADTVGNRTLAQGILRIFSRRFPACGGAEKWNVPSGWRSHWKSIPPNIFFFAEDVYGNQLGIGEGSATATLWNHENGNIIDLELDAVEFLKWTLKNGLAWTDFYTTEALDIAKAKAPGLPDEFHLHWTVPLVLGGEISENNLSVVERFAHLQGHGMLWEQIERFPPGTEIVPNHG